MEACYLGSCSQHCGGAELLCDATCWDPRTDEAHCGAQGYCGEVFAGTVCGASKLCSGGRCGVTCTTQSFSPWTYWNTYSNTYCGAALGDLNGDGHTDVAAAFCDVSRVLILLGDGAGGVKSSHLFDVHARAPRLADIDRHGDLDLVTGGTDAARIALNNGNATFSAPAILQTGAAEVVLGDLNCDGLIDVVVTSSTTVSSHLNDGDGTFSLADLFASGLAAHRGPYNLADLDDDGRPDLAIAEVKSGGLGTLKIYQGNGDGTFGDSLNLAMITGGRGGQPVLGDVGADGHPDIVLANEEGWSFSVFRNVGDGSFAARQDRSTSPLTSARIADLNHDGTGDVLFTGVNRWWYGMADAAGTISALTEIFAYWNAFDSLEIGDLNGDRRLDVVHVGAVPSGYMNLGRFLNTCTQ